MEYLSSFSRVNLEALGYKMILYNLILGVGIFQSISAHIWRPFILIY